MHSMKCESLWVTGSFWALGKSRRMVNVLSQCTELKEKHADDRKDDHHKQKFNLVGLLKACAKKKDLREGVMLHADIQKRGLLKKDLYLASSLINMYARCGKLAKAQQLLEELPVRDVAIWSALITGYAMHGQGWEALNCFEQMQNEGVSPDAVTYICILKACSCIGAIDQGIQIHKDIMRAGLLNKDMMLATALVDMYAKCGLLDKARQALEGLPVRDVVAWSALAVGYAQQGQSDEALECFKQMQDEGLCPDSFTFSCILKACGSAGAIDIGKRIHEEIVSRQMLDNNIVLGNALVDMYAKCGVLKMSQEVFDGLLVRDVVSWNALIAAYAQQGQGHEALIYFERMQSEGLSPNTVTFVCVLKACGATRSVDKGIQIHQKFVGRGMVEKDILLGTALVDMYAKCDELEKAHQLLEHLPLRNVVSWSALISGYAQQGQGHGALDCLEWMRREGFSPNAVTLTCILKACANIGAIDKGRQIHDEILNRGLLEKDVLLGNALVDMYAKCGLLRKAQQVLEELPVRDVASWNALITGYALQGHAHEALNCLQKMQHDGLSPNSITFVSVLSACSRRGLLDAARSVYMGMTRRHGITATVGHHTCMVVVFGHAGDFDGAMSVIKVMPSSDYSAVWLALLGGCRKWGNLELGKLAFDQVVQLDDGCTQAYVFMANLFAAAGMTKDAERLEAMRSKYAPPKTQGKSIWVDGRGDVHTFSSRDMGHCQSRQIDAKLKEIAFELVRGGHCRSTDWVLSRGRKDVQCGHRDKAAIACALLNTCAGEAIHVTNTTHMCDHCHVTASLISRAVKRKILVRVPDQLHVFEAGECAACS